MNLAAQLLLDAFDDSFDLAVVISNDSDLAWPILMVRKKFEKNVGILGAAPRGPGDQRRLRQDRQKGPSVGKASRRSADHDLVDVRDLHGGALVDGAVDDRSPGNAQVDDVAVVSRVGRGQKAGRARTQPGSRSMAAIARSTAGRTGPGSCSRASRACALRTASAATAHLPEGHRVTGGELRFAALQALVEVGLALQHPPHVRRCRPALRGGGRHATRRPGPCVRLLRAAHQCNSSAGACATQRRVPVWCQLCGRIASPTSSSLWAGPDAGFSPYRSRAAPGPPFRHGSAAAPPGVWRG